MREREREKEREREREKERERKRKRKRERERERWLRNNPSCLSPAPYKVHCNYSSANTIPDLGLESDFESENKEIKAAIAAC